MFYRLLPKFILQLFLQALVLCRTFLLNSQRHQVVCHLLQWRGRRIYPWGERRIRLHEQLLCIVAIHPRIHELAARRIRIEARLIDEHPVRIRPDHDNIRCHLMVAVPADGIRIDIIARMVLRVYKAPCPLRHSRRTQQQQANGCQKYPHTCMSQ